MKLSSKQLIVITISLIAIASSAYAFTVPETYTPLSPLPDVSSQGLGLATSVSFSTYVKYAFNLLIALGAVAAVFMITWGGFEYMTTDAVQGKKEGLTKIQNAIYGLLMVLSSYLIMRTIDPRFVSVPSTLVTPLNLQATNQIKSWSDNLQQQINAYDIHSAEIAESLSSAIDKNASLMAQEKDIAGKIADYTGIDDPLDACSEVYYGNDDPQLTDLCAQWLDNKNQQDQVKASATNTINQKTINSYAGQALKSPDTIGQKQIDDLANLYQKALSDAQKNGITSQQFQPIMNDYYLADSQLRMAYANNAPAYVYPQLKQVVDTDISRVSDPAIKNAMIDSTVTKIDSLLASANKNTTYYDNLDELKKQAQGMKAK